MSIPDTSRDDVHHSRPIPISTEHLRHRSVSFSSDSSTSPSSPPLVTPKGFPQNQIPVSSSSPILYYLSQSPSKTSATFPFRGFAPPPVIEDESAEEPRQHTRRASTAGRFQPPLPVTEAHHERGVNVLRRLSLGQRPKPLTPQSGVPSTPPNSAGISASSSAIISSNSNSSRKSRRSATLSEQTRRRAPSPMGERILKGHFDGFN